MSCDRRDFVRHGTAALAVVLLPGCASLVTRRVPVENGLVRLSLRQYPELAEPRGSLRLMPDGWEDPVYLLALDDGGFAAVSSICTHRGCTVDLGGPGFACPCHGSQYDREGRVVKGPGQPSTHSLCDTGLGRRAGDRSGGNTVNTPNAVTLGLMLALATPAFAQQRDTVRADTTRPFVRGGVYDKPYQTRLLGRTAIGGYAEAHARYERVDGLIEDSGFELKRFNLFTSTRVSDFVRIAAEVEIEEAGEEIKLEYAAIDVRIHQLLTVRGGMLLSPLGRFNLAHDSPLNEFTDRPLVSTEVLGVALSEPGFGVLGQAPVGRQGRLTWEAYMTNGFDDGLIVNSPEGTRIPLGRGNIEDQNSSPALVGRLAWSPSVGWSLAFPDITVPGTCSGLTGRWWMSAATCR
jgi:nitrite reductase/ring-hydroxylating ferredoxin subunit